MEPKNRVRGRVKLRVDGKDWIIQMTPAGIDVRADYERKHKIRRMKLEALVRWMDGQLL